MYIRLIDSTLRENENLFRLNDQQKVYMTHVRDTNSEPGLPAILPICQYATTKTAALFMEQKRIP